MPSYVVDPANATTPLDSNVARQGAEEFRALKAYVQSLLRNIISWNSADTSPSILLTGLNLIATKNNIDVLYHAARGNTPLKIGKIYWEITINSLGAILPIFGIGTINATLENYIGFDTFGYGYGGSLGNKFNAGVSTAFGAAFVANDTLGFALDLTVPQIQIFKNNVSQGTIALPAGQTWYPMASMASNGEQNTINFGDQAFKYTPPTGFSSVVTTLVIILKDFFAKQYFPTF